MFEKTLSADKTERKIKITMDFSETDSGFKLSVTDEDNFTASEELQMAKEISNSSDNSQIRKQLSKLGGTIFTASDIKINPAEKYFIPVSILNDLRRKVIDKLLQKRISGYKIEPFTIDKTEIPYPYKKADYRHNISNHLAEKFYRRHGVEEIENSFETSTSRITGPLMTTKLCLKYENNLCHKQNSSNKKFTEPYYLIDGNIRYRVEFDCKDCFMLIFKE
jgi:putative protease